MDDLKNNRACHLTYFKLCASFHSYQWIQIGVTVSKHPFWVLCDLEIWWMTLTNNGASLLRCIKLCPSFHYHMWIQTGVTVRKWLNQVLTSVTFTFDTWPWSFACTLLLSMVITTENLTMIRWWEHSVNGVTDGWMERQTDRQTEPVRDLLGGS